MLAMSIDHVGRSDQRFGQRPSFIGGQIQVAVGTILDSDAWRIRPPEGCAASRYVQAEPRYLFACWLTQGSPFRWWSGIGGPHQDRSVPHHNQYRKSSRLRFVVTAHELHIEPGILTMPIHRRRATHRYRAFPVGRLVTVHTGHGVVHPMTSLQLQANLPGLMT